MKKIGIIGIFLGITLIILSLVIFNSRSSSLKNDSSNEMKIVDKSKSITGSLELEKYKPNIEIALNIVSDGENVVINDLKFLEIDESGNYVVLSNIGYVYKFNDNADLDNISSESYIRKDDLFEIECNLHKYKNGNELCIENPIIPISLLIYKNFIDKNIDINNGYIEHIDGNIYNNNINNLKYINDSYE